MAATARPDTGSGRRFKKGPASIIVAITNARIALVAAPVVIV